MTLSKRALWYCCVTSVVVVLSQFCYFFLKSIQSLIDSGAIVVGKNSEIHFNVSATFISYRIIRHSGLEILQTLGFIVLIVSITMHWNEEGIKFSCCQWPISKKCVIACIALIILSALTLGLIVINMICIPERRRCHVPTKDTLDLVLAGMNFLFESTNIVMDYTVWVIVTGLVLNYINEWESSLDKFEKPSCNKSADIYILIYYKQYHEIGRVRTKATRETLQAWFVIRYIVFLIYIYIDLVHVILPHFNENVQELQHYKKIIVIQFILYFAYGIVAFVLSCTLALWMVNAHRKCYADMMNRLHKIDDLPDYIDIIHSSQMNKLLHTIDELILLNFSGTIQSPQSHLQNTPYEISNTEEEERQQTSQSQVSSLKSLTFDELIKLKLLAEAHQLRMKNCKYYSEIIQRKIELCKDYDFTPCLFDISIPLNNPGYIMTLLLALFSLLVVFAN